MTIARKEAIISVTVGATSFVGLEGRAFKFHTDGTAIPIASDSDSVAGVILEGAAVGQEASVLLNARGGPTAYAKLAAVPGSVVRGTLLEITSDGRFVAAAGGGATVAAMALEAGAADERIEVSLLGTSGTVSLSKALETTLDATAAGAVLTAEGQVQDASGSPVAGHYIVGIFFGEAANDGTPHDFGDLAAQAGSAIVREITTDAYAEVLTAADGSWGVELTVASSDTVHSNAWVVGRVAVDSTEVTVG